MSEEKKRCPFCGEEILSIAKKCKHCGSYLNKGSITSQAQDKPKSPADYEVFLLAIPVIGILLIWFWVPGMNLLQSPGSILSLIMLATVLGTAIVAAMEASKVGMQTDREKGSYSPTAWFFIIALLWIIGYPAYLFKRRHYGLANRLVAGILIAIIFVGSWGIIQAAIAQKSGQIKGTFSRGSVEACSQCEKDAYNISLAITVYFVENGKMPSKNDLDVDVEYPYEISGEPDGDIFIKVDSLGECPQKYQETKKNWSDGIFTKKH